MYGKTKYNPAIHHRKSIRLKGYDYAQAGLYFITICCQNRACLFGKVVNGVMVLNNAGKIADECWMEIPNHFPHAVLHEYVIMPNHIHGIIELIPIETKNLSPHIKETNVENGTHVVQHNNSNVILGMNSINEANDGIDTNDVIRSDSYSPRRSPSRTIGSVIRGFKIGVTKWMRQNTDIYSVWQRDYYEHIIRNEKSYQNISDYIRNNPTKWGNDKFFEK